MTTTTTARGELRSHGRIVEAVGLGQRRFDGRPRLATLGVTLQDTTLLRQIEVDYLRVYQQK